MKALILNSGMGKRMGSLTSEYPKCMKEIGKEETIISRQLKLLQQFGINEIIMTTGFLDKVLVDYCYALNLPLHYIFVKNPVYYKTNYIYSIYLAKEYLCDSIVLMHGDLVFEPGVLQDVIKQNNSCMTVSSTIPLPSKDFKAVIKDNLIKKIGVEFFDNALEAQPLYKLKMIDWKVWLDSIVVYCKAGRVNCYAENAFNDISDQCRIYPVDYTDRLCAEIDTPADFSFVQKKIDKENIK
jgi:choline kinase